MSGLQRTALVLTIIGAINWGLIGFFGFDLIAAIFGSQAQAMARVIYALVGIAGLYSISILMKPDEELERSPEPQR
ncbi:DUF378 domain-containing protein [Salibacterium salarium]|uniref:DUF378 domain-containing protein n=1 Tax=Salibacterium salarium TaxID=284579 RepID=A0A3R9QML7_9BACI|nr:DUF378 domain-containing protein [Salibacterium salarium]RSL34161.1 DUF378 domain-containing protein [Salibacterium salarium]